VTSTAAPSQPDATTAPADATTAIVDDPTAIDTLRGQIDALDTAIARLVSERVQLSQRIQTARMNAGGTRVELGRERAILDHYRSQLGSTGAALGDAVLRVCKADH
jgi:chorismate mutase